MKPINIQKLTELIVTYQIVANSPTSSNDELIDSANAIPLYLYENGYDAEQNDELMNYLLKATDVEAAEYWLNNFLPKFKQLNTMNYHWNEDTINHFRFESKYDSYANIKERVKEFVEIDCSLENGETEEMLVEDLLNQIYNTNK